MIIYGEILREFQKQKVKYVLDTTELIDNLTKLRYLKKERKGNGKIINCR